MAIIDLRPNTTGQTGAWSRTGGTSHHGVLADSSDSTYISGSGAQTTSQMARVGLTNPTSMPAGAKVVAARTWVRGRSNTEFPGSRVSVAQWDPPSTAARTDQFTFSGTSAATWYGAWQVTSPGGSSPWDAASLTNLQLWRY